MYHVVDVKSDLWAFLLSGSNETISILRENDTLDRLEKQFAGMLSAVGDLNRGDFFCVISNS